MILLALYQHFYMKKAIFIYTAIFFLSIHFSFGQSRPLGKKELEELFYTMAGEFSSAEQSVKDSSYFHITLRMKPFMKDDKDGYWLYVEQAMHNSQDKPYRQRVYHLYLNDDSTIISKVYELKNAGKYTGGWKDSQLLTAITKDSLVDRQGCGIFLRKINNSEYAGSTPGKECLSSLRGATYATSEVVISPDKIVSWDRGWDDSGKQVWGAVKGGYIFKKGESFRY